MQLMGKRPKSHLRKIVAFLAIFALLVGILGVVNPGAAVAKTGDSSSATEVVLTIKVNVNGKTTTAAEFTKNELQQMPQQQRVYSSVDSMPAPLFTATKGVMLKDLLTAAGIDLKNVQGFEFRSSDNYLTSLTKQYLFDTPRYYFPKIKECWDKSSTLDNIKLKPGVEDGKIPVEPILALLSYQARFNDGPEWEKIDDKNAIRLCFGQKDSQELTNNKFAKWLEEIEVKLLESSELIAPILTADTASTFGSSVEITFMDDNAWRNAITEVNVEGNVLDSDQYSKAEGKITIDAGVFAAAGTYNIVIKADGYQDAAVAQVIAPATVVEPDLIITGSKVAQVMEYAVADLQGLEKDTSWPPTATDKKPVIRNKYSAVGKGLKRDRYSTEGVRVKYLLEQAGVQSGYGKITFYSSDGWETELTEEEINEKRYYFPVDLAGEAVPIEPILAYQSRKWSDQEEPDFNQMKAEEPLRLFLGQKTADEVNTNKFAKMVVKMEVGESVTTPVLESLTLSDNPSLTFSGEPFTYDLGNLTLTAKDQSGKVFDLIGQTVTWTVESGPATVSGKTLTVTGSGTVGVTATVNGVTSNVLNITIQRTEPTTSMIIKIDNGTPVTVTVDDINALNPNQELRCYSYHKFGTLNYYTSLGAPLSAILSEYASINSSDVQSITVKSIDGYSMDFTGEELFGTRYFYSQEEDPGQEVETIIATRALGNITNDLNQLDDVACLRLFMGQANSTERTNSWMVRWVSELEITTFPGSGFEPDDSLYIIKPIEDATYQIGKTSAGISTMTVNTGVSGMNYFNVEVIPVKADGGLKTVVFVHLRNSVQRSLNAIKTDFDVVDNVLAGFNVEPSDMIKVYIVDELSNVADFNPTILQ